MESASLSKKEGRTAFQEALYQSQLINSDNYKSGDHSCTLRRDTRIQRSEDRLTTCQPSTPPRSSLVASFIHSFNHSFIPQSVLREVHSLFQSQFSSQCDPVLPLSTSSILSFQGHKQLLTYSSSSFRDFQPSLPSSLPPSSFLPSTFPSVTLFIRQFLCKM